MRGPPWTIRTVVSPPPATPGLRQVTSHCSPAHVSTRPPWHAVLLTLANLHSPTFISPTHPPTHPPLGAAHSHTHRQAAESRRRRGFNFRRRLPSHQQYDAPSDHKARPHQPKGQALCSWPTAPGQDHKPEDGVPAQPSALTILFSSFIFLIIFPKNIASCKRALKTFILLPFFFCFNYFRFIHHGIDASHQPDLLLCCRLTGWHGGGNQGGRERDRRLLWVLRQGN